MLFPMCQLSRVNGLIQRGLTVGNLTRAMRYQRRIVVHVSLNAAPAA